MNVCKVSRLSEEGESVAVHIEMDAYDAEILYRHLRELQSMDPHCSDQINYLADFLCLTLRDPEIHAERMRQTMAVDPDFEGEDPPELPDWLKSQPIKN